MRCENGKIIKTIGNDKEIEAYLMIFKYLSPDIAEKIDRTRIRTGTAFIDFLKSEFLKGSKHQLHDEYMEYKMMLKNI